MLTIDDTAAFAERSLRKNGYLAQVLFFEGTKDIEIREFPNYPERALSLNMEALGFMFASTDCVGDLIHFFFLCQTWFNRNAGIRVTDDPRKFEGVFLYQCLVQSGNWDCVSYKIVRDQRGKVIELKTVKSPETVFSDVVIGPVVDRFFLGFRRGLAEKRKK